MELYHTEQAFVETQMKWKELNEYVEKEAKAPLKGRTFRPN